MTHFRCAVFCYDPHRFDDMLAPYSETDRTYYRFIPSTRTEEQFRADYEKNKIPHDDEFPDFEQWLKDIGYVREHNIIGYYGNPNAKWDWYSLDGGDWQFELLEDEEYDDRGFARKNQFDYLSHISDSTCAAMYKSLKKDAESDDEYARDEAIEMLKAFPTLEEYMDYMKYNWPYAFITPDGVWHAPGNIGWFASSNDSAVSRKEYMEDWKRWINSPDNPYVNFVDCHI